MRASIISLFVFAILVLAIILNAIYINSIIGDLTNEVMGLEIESYIEVMSVYEKWSRHHFYICLGTPHDKTDKVEECFLVILEKARGGECEGFFEYKALLLNYLNDIKRVHAFSFDAIV